MKKVLVFGSFDVIHPGHLYFFREAHKYGDSLTVVVARDKTIREVKGKDPINPESRRLENVGNLSIVDRAIIGNDGDKYRVIQDVHPDVICLGYDQDSFSDKLSIKLKELGLDIPVFRLRKYIRPGWRQAS
ncbi:MAG: adenylyltransferase/cytidyltransferase family protein [archaeon]